MFQEACFINKWPHFEWQLRPDLLVAGHVFKMVSEVVYRSDRVTSHAEVHYIGTISGGQADHSPLHY